MRIQLLGVQLNLSQVLPLGAHPTSDLPPLAARQRRLTAEEIVQILLAYRARASIADLAKQHGVRCSTISELLRRSGIPIRVARVLDDAGVHEAARLYQLGWSLARVGTHLGFDAETIRQHLKRHGVQPRSPWDRP